MAACKKMDEKSTPCIVLVDKPKGITSFDVIRKLRKTFGVRKMGHAGTLDPLATGLLVVGVGTCTKKLRDYVGLPKTYEVEVLLGRKTTTGDMEGEVVEQKKVSPIDRKEVLHVLDAMRGILPLPVPLYSAIKREGKPLYAYARSGQTVEVPVKKMRIYRIELLDMTQDGGEAILSLRMDVGSGAYVRSIAEAIGKRLGVPATVKELRRTRVGEFDVKDAITI